ncbi:MAG TPA: RNA polymerase sigma factor [Polyangiaceae bacterium]
MDLASQATIRATTAPLGDIGGSDDQILDAVRRGDRKEALLLCARHHGRSVGRLCMALLGSASEADDALQDTLLAAHAAFPGYRGEGSLRAWLFSIARRRCAKVLERRSTRTGVERRAAEDGAPKSADTADTLLDARRRAEEARALLAQVRPSEREALLLRYEAGLSYREVGEACGIDEAAARKRVSRALARLRELAKE